LAFILNEHPEIVGPRKYRYHSPLISAEWCAFTNFPWGRGLINFAPEEYDKAMETYATWLRLFELQRYYSWIIDRFHLSTRLYQSQHNQREINFDWLESGLRDLGFHLVLCTRTHGSFERARAERLKVSGNPGQYDDPSIYVDEQESFQELAARATLPVLEIDVSQGDLQANAQEIAGWLRSTGGLWST